MRDDCYTMTRCDMRPLEDFIPEVMVSAPDLPEEIVANFVRQAAIEFCQRSHIIRQIIPVHLQACVSDVLLEPDCDMNIISIRALCAEGNCGQGAPSEQDYSTSYTNPNRTRALLNQQRNAQSYNLVPERPCQLSCNGSSVWFVPPHTLTIPIPPKQDRQNAFYALVSVAPQEEACELPEFFYQTHRRYLTAGALAEVYAMKKSGVYDLRLSEMKRKQFDAGVTAASIQRLLGYGTGPVAVRPKMRYV